MSEMTLLLVEDNDDDRFLTIRTLKKLPHEVRTEIARNGDEALQRLFGEGSSIPSLILLDLQLPKIGGTTFLAKVRERFPNRDLPVIILSSSDNPLDIKLCRELGISGYLSKPLDLAALQELLATIIPP